MTSNVCDVRHFVGLIVQGKLPREARSELCWRNEPSLHLLYLIYFCTFLKFLSLADDCKAHENSVLDPK